MDLEKIQFLFLNNILQPESDNNITFINADKQLSASDRMGIYAVGYQLNLIEALMENYPALHTLLGDEDFENLAREYISTHPSNHFSLRYLGDKMVDFTKHHAVYKDIEFIPEMANFEWELRQAFDSSNVTPLSRNELSHISATDWPDLHFKLLPSFTLFTLNWNTPFLWKAIIQDQPPRPPEKLENSQQWIIWRPKLETHFRSVENLEAIILAQFSENKSFSDVCELADLEIGEGSEKKVIDYLNRWIDEGLLLSFG